MWVALENDIYIPTSAQSKKETPVGKLSALLVEIEGGYSRPVTSCSQRVEEGMIVRTRTPAVDRLVKTAFELLLSDHDLNCSGCPGGKNPVHF